MPGKSSAVDRALQPSFLSDLDAALPFFAPTTRRSEHHAERIDWNSLLRSLGEALDVATVETRQRAATLLEGHLASATESPLVGSVSVFEALGYTRYELAHTQALGWLFDPQGRHGFGKALLRTLLSCITPGERFNQQLLDEIVAAIEHSEISVSCEDWLSTNCRADVLLEGKPTTGRPWSIVIEAKIDARERKNQLRDVLAHAPHQAKFGIFITQDGATGSSGDADWAQLSYFQWARALLRLQPALAEMPGSAFLRFYITGLLEDICGITGGKSCEEVVRNNSPFDIEKLLEA